MSNNRHHHSELIDRIGAPAVAERFNLTPQRLHNWRNRGIPQLQRLAFQNLAAAHGVVLPSDFLHLFYGEEPHLVDGACRLQDSGVVHDATDTVSGIEPSPGKDDDFTAGQREQAA